MIFSSPRDGHLRARPPFWGLGFCLTSTSPVIDQDKTHSNNKGSVGTPDGLKYQLKVMRDREERNASESLAAQGLSWSVCPLPKGHLVLASTVQLCPGSFSGARYPSRGHRVHLCSAPFPEAHLPSPDCIQTSCPPSPHSSRR